MSVDDQAGITKDVSEYEPPKTATGSPLFIAIGSPHSASRIQWRDDGDGKLETKLRDIVAEVLVHAEASYRSTCENLHKWRIERRANRLEELYVSRLKAEQAERDRI